MSDSINLDNKKCVIIICIVCSYHKLYLSFHELTYSIE